MIQHPALRSGNVALITGGATGIGFAIAHRLAALGMDLVLVDKRAEALAASAATLGAVSVMEAAVDVADRNAVEAMQNAVNERFGGIDVLINNAGIGRASTALGPVDAWQSTLDVNLWGIINGCQVFVPDMIKRGNGGIVINTGSKQGITTPPGNPAYNVSKAAVKAYTEALEHELRNTDGARITAHLLIPGFVFTEMTAGDRTERPAAAWTPDETAAFALERVGAGDFYILCPDNDVSRQMDEKRIAWAAGDIIENRPPLSRWHPDWTERFKAFLSGT